MEFKKAVLKNGMTLLFEKREVPVTTVMLATKFGSINEQEKEKGVAHFIEHLCFKGTKKRTTFQIAAELEKVGGNLNAFTSEEETAYHVKLPSQHLNLAMDVIFDIFFNPLFPEEEIKKEANVICEEIKMYYDNPRMRAMDKIKDCLYKKPFGLSIAGSEESVRGMKREDLLKKHKEYYCSKNAILSVVGNNDFEEVLKLAEKYSVECEGKEIEIPKISLQNKKEREERVDIQQANLIIGIHFPKANEKGRYASEIVSAILGEGMSSKLFTEIREKRGLAYAVKTDLDVGKNYGYLIIYVGTDKGKIEQVIDLSIKELKKLSEISEKELKEAKEQLIGNYLLDSEDCAKTALNLILEEISGKAEDYYSYKENIEKVSLQDINNLLKFQDYSYYCVLPAD
jgi:predicted Zn-dependent peptidase